MFAVRFFHLSRGLVQLRRWEPLTRTLCSVLGPMQIPGKVLAAACEVLEDKEGLLRHHGEGGRPGRLEGRGCGAC